MKNPFFKALALSGAMVVIWNCNADTPVANASTTPLVSANITTDSWLLEDQNLLITPSSQGFLVTTTDGTPIGAYNPATGTVVDAAGTEVLTSLDLNTLPKVTTTGTIIYTDGTVTDLSGNPVSAAPTTGVDNSTNTAGTTTGTTAGTTTGTTAGTTGANTGAATGSNTGAAVGTNTGTTTGTATGTNTGTATGTNTSSNTGSQNNTQTSNNTSSNVDQNQGSQTSNNNQTLTSGSITVTGSLNQSVAKGASISTVVFSNVTKEPQRDWNIYFVTGQYDQNAKTYTLSGSVPDYLSDGATLSDKYTFEDGSFTFSLTIGQGGSTSSNNNNNNNNQQTQQNQNNQNNQQQQAQSSSSQPKSSSSQQQQQNNNNQQQSNGTSPNIQEVSGGISGSGKATRYWDSCKPHCAWDGKDKESNVGVARTCHADGSKASSDEASACDGGPAGTCADQAPVIVNDEYAYAFAAYSGNGAVCGRCFMLTFNGTTDNGSKSSINGKKLIVMISNIGYDVQQGNFDIMIPGGGVGAFSGCSKMGISCAGAQYGGLLTTCNGDKSCLIEKCNSEYSNTNLKNGCLFLANWLDAADNPHHTFKQVVCPSELLQKF